MSKDRFDDLFTPDLINRMFPDNRADRFFDALYGDPSEGAYDIKLVFKQSTADTLLFEFHLTQRSQKCLRCNLTYGLPGVFSRHPVINVKGLVQQIDQHLNGQGKCVDWKLGTTREISDELHVIPLTINVENTA